MFFLMHAFKYLCTSIFINATTILSGQCSVSRTIVHSPFILAVMFKRYETSDGGISTRNATPVSFPTDLEIPQEIVGKSLPYLPSSFFSFNLLCPFSFFFSFCFLYIGCCACRNRLHKPVPVQIAVCYSPRPRQRQPSVLASWPLHNLGC